MPPPSPSSTVTSTVSARFIALSTTSGATEALSHAWSRELIAHYTESHRAYHTLSHITSMLSCLDAHRSTIQDEVAVELAIYFHDWIYDPLSKSNETDSMVVFEEFAAAANLKGALKSKVLQMIERTITHTLPHGSVTKDQNGREDGDLWLFLDFDLEILSRSEAEYETYAKQIREEYSHYKDSEYRSGRAKVLRGFLERPKIYFSKTFRPFEEDARRNLQTEIEKLEAI